MVENIKPSKRVLSHLPQRPAINIEFQDLTYTVPQGRKGSKLILRSINGQFRSGQLHAILGPSGAGKSTLLNILAGYKSNGATGSITVNGELRNVKMFRKMSRYIMQEDMIQPLLTVQEAMLVAANLKLSRELTKEQKLVAVEEILEMLRLIGAKNTTTGRLSGGERKRLSIALELVNNPPVIFLDEPTTGLDDLSSSQCISLLKLLAEGGRTVICSIHTPSSKLFSMFDNVYIIASGQCVYQGYGLNVVPFLSDMGIICPTHYNPADFVIEVCSGEYGDHAERMVMKIDNGRTLTHMKPTTDISTSNEEQIISVVTHNMPGSCTSPMSDMQPIHKYDSSTWMQFKILLLGMWLQMWRDTNYLLMKTALYIILGLLVGNVFIGMGKDGSKTIFNFGFYFTCVIAFMYIPLMPVLLHFPTQVQLLKREYFNQWYSLKAYFCALTVSTLPVQVLLGSLFISLVYILTDQPLEVDRMIMFFSVCTLTAFISESFGLVISSTLSIVNGMFVGPVLTVPFMLLAVYGFGSGSQSIPVLIRFAMYFSYLRYALEGLIAAMLSNRPKLPCPETEDFCIYTDLKFFVREMGMENTVFWIDIVALCACFLIFRAMSFYLLRQRLKPNKTFVTIHFVGRFIKSYLSIR